MSAPGFRPPGRGSLPARPYPPNLFPGTAHGHERHDKIAGQPPVTPKELGFYTIQTLIRVLFCRVRSHWGSRATGDTEINPLIGLPNQHIVGLTYVP
ncbi:hypothetical protein GCM10018980_03390 [Streptomyces capoamus]|uniref:Uncharacterized protein n=1 Tax=Streptomyces capoamus TaxID=68183 RepID=A0A919BZH1_9ACTN|nr:hypothetical protein GCM10010501_11390 [Streptomyces libani subsp. rufus]GHG34115.1 hypothetical protein GCM10018980_03390 [Streptomyces capoamus]